MQAAQEGNAIDLTSGIQERDFTCVHDIAEGLLRLALCPHPPKLLNLGTGRLLSVREFCRVAAKVFAMPEEHLRFGTRTDRDDEMKHEPVNISRLTSALEWQPTNDVREGIQRAWNARIEKEDS
jgi:GDP-L-fucose synthase